MSYLHLKIKKKGTFSLSKFGWTKWIKFLVPEIYSQNVKFRILILRLCFSKLSSTPIRNLPTLLST